MTRKTEKRENSPSRAYIRYQRMAHIGRKKRIIRNMNGYWGYTHEGELAKGKIHCSCWMCRLKSHEYPSKRDMSRKESMKQQLTENPLV